MPTNDKLSRREREIMDVLYALGDNASADEIRERLIRERLLLEILHSD